MKKNKFLLSFILILTSIIISGCEINKPKKDINYKVEENIKYESYTIKTGEINKEDIFVGTIEPYEYTILSSQIGGKIIKINKKEGDYVKKGEILVQTDMSESVVGLNSSESIVNSLYELKENTSKMFDSQIKAMEEQVAQTQKAMDTIDTQSDKQVLGDMQILQNKIGIQSNTIELENMQNILNQQEIQIYSNTKNTFSQTKTLLVDLGIYIDKLLGISDQNKSTNYDIKVFLGAKNVSQKNETEILWNELNKYWSELQLEIEDISKINFEDLLEEQKKQIYTILGKTNNFLDKTKYILDQVYEVLENSIAGTDFTNIDINNHKQIILNYKANLEKTILYVDGNNLLGIKGSIQNIDNFNKNSKMQLDLLIKKQELSVNQYEMSKESINAQYQIAYHQNQEAIAGLEALKEQKNMQMSNINIQIAESYGQRSIAHIQINNTQITSPFEGIVVEKFVNIGQVVGQGIPIISIGQNKKLKIFIMIPENQISQIELNNIVTIKIPSLGKEFVGKIESIDPSYDITTKKIPVKIVFDNNYEDIKLGMYAQVILTKRDILGFIVPIDYIRYSFAQAYLIKMKSNKTERINITKPLCQIDYCVVQSEFLNYGDEIIK